MLAIIMFGVGFVSGMYILTQIEKSIDKNINSPEWTREDRMEMFLDEYNMLKMFNDLDEENNNQDDQLYRRKKPNG